MSAAADPMRLEERLNPELAGLLRALPPDLMDITDITAARERFATLFASALQGSRPIEGVETRSVVLDRSGISARVHRPLGEEQALPCVIWIHGGGFVTGTVEQDDGLLRRLVREVMCVAVSADYRLAPEYPYPTPLEDCYAVLRWTVSNAEKLRIDPARLAVAGASAGGGLAAGLTLLARDRGEVSIAFQQLIYPMLDDRARTRSSTSIADGRVWNRVSNELAWRSYLGVDPGSQGVSRYAAPARAPSLHGLPPAYVGVGEVDIFRDEAIAYASRLMEVGVPTELHVHPGVFHGWDLFAPQSRLARRARSERFASLREALHSDGTGQ